MQRRERADGAVLLPRFLLGVVLGPDGVGVQPLELAPLAGSHSAQRVVHVPVAVVVQHG